MNIKKDNYERITECIGRDQMSAPEMKKAKERIKELEHSLLKVAKKLYEEILRINPNHFESILSLGVLLIKTKSFDQAKQLLQTAIQIDPNHANAHNNLGIVLQELKEFQKAKSCYEKAIQIDPNFIIAHNNLGAVFHELRDYKKAISCCQKVIEIQPNHANAHDNLGILFQELKEFQKAKSCHEKAIQIDPNHVSAHNNLGLTFKELKEFQKAIRSYQQAILINPNYTNSINNLAILLKEFQFNNVTKANSNNLKKLFLLLFRRNDINHKDIFHNAKIFLFIDEIKKEIDSFFNSNSLLIKEKIIQKLFKEELFLLILQKSLIFDRLLEKILTKLRYEILFIFLKSNNNILKENFEFIISLSEQCFLNEYVFSQSKKEIDYINQLKTSFKKNKNIDELEIAILGCYEPLFFNLELINKLSNYRSENILFNDLINLQIKEPLKEKELLNSIKSLKKISNNVSIKVRKQYEENPYPRWRYTYPNIPTKFLSQLNYQIKPNKIETNNKFDNPEVLIAGCGTGSHVFSTKNYLNANILAVDLSLKSLAYAKRKTKELNFKNIEFLHADILQLKKLNKKFDIIESVGVIHHMKDPIKGLKTLLDLLEPHGLLKLGLYSEKSRQDIIRARKFIKKNKFKNTIKDIRNCRQAIIAKKNDQLLQKIPDGPDFYSTSSARDLLFHVQEHRFTLQKISKILLNLNLEFLGFDNSLIKNKFLEVFPKDKSDISLNNWNKFETNNPDIFIGMYKFWVRKIK